MLWFPKLSVLPVLLLCWILQNFQTDRIELGCLRLASVVVDTTQMGYGSLRLKENRSILLFIYDLNLFIYWLIYY